MTRTPHSFLNCAIFIVIFIFVRPITGKITAFELNDHGIIDGKYFFFWDALSTDYRVVNIDDKVSADCIECEKGSSYVFEWRCLKVVLVENAVERLLDNSNLRVQRNRDTENKNGIEISDDVVIDLNDLNETKEFAMTVKNTSDLNHKVLESVFIGNKSDSQLELISPARNTSFFLQPGEEKEYLFRATSKFYGDAIEKFYIKFSGPTRPFKIFRNITVSVFDTEQAHSTMGTGVNLTKNRTYSQRIFRKDLTGTIPGVPLKRTANFVKIKFEHYEVPDSLKGLVLESASSRSYINETLDLILSYMKENLNEKNYSSVFHTLLHLEECEMFHNMRKYDRKSFFTRERDFLALTVENIAESRPSIVLGE